MKNQKGITMISLIITIAVMAIIMGITIATTLKTNIFNTARKTLDEYEQKENSISQDYAEHRRNTN